MNIVGILPQPEHPRDKGQNFVTVPAILGKLATMREEEHVCKNKSGNNFLLYEEARIDEDFS